MTQGSEQKITDDVTEAGPENGSAEDTTKTPEEIFTDAYEMLGSLEKRVASAEKFLEGERSAGSKKADEAQKAVTASLAQDFMVAIASLDDEVAAVETIDASGDAALSSMVDGVRLINAEVKKTVEKHGLNNAEGQKSSDAEGASKVSLSLGGGKKKSFGGLKAINPFKGMDLFLSRAAEQVEALKTITPEEGSEESQEARLGAEIEEQIARLTSVNKDYNGLAERQSRDIENKTLYGATKLAKDFLSVVDNMDRAVKAAESQAENNSNETFKTMLSGVREARSELIQAFEKNGIVRDEPMAEQFDPNKHEAMFQAPVPGKKKGEIISVEEAGYALNGRVLRAAKVGFAQ